MPTVLVADDEFGIARLLEDVLTDEGYRVVLAANGRQALERMAPDPPNLVLADYMMPVMDGAGLLQAMAADARFRDIPVVLMSSIPEQTVAERCSGYVRFVRKPFRIFDMVDLVAEIAGPPG